jgi:peptide/nickel transport system permease protein
VGRYTTQRLSLAIPTLVGLSLVIFVILRVVMPVDAVDLATADAEIVDEVREQELREEFGLTGPLPVQYVRWLGNLLIGDFGKSFYTGRSVSSELAYRVPTSLELGAGALLITVVFAVPIGLLSAVKQDTSADYLTRGVAILLYAVPGFWVATLILVFGSIWWGWAPRIDFRPLWEDPVANLHQMWLPMLILGLHPIGTMTRLVRTQVLEVIRQDYVRTARAKGLGWQAIYFRHILRNSLLPLVTVIGLQLPRLVAGTVIFEQIFVLPGMGPYLLGSLQRLDLYVVMGTNLIFGSILVLSNLLVDLSYGLIDPRIRFAK